MADLDKIGGLPVSKDLELCLAVSYCVSWRNSIDWATEYRIKFRALTILLTEKRTKPIFSYLDQTSSVNKGYIIWPSVDHSLHTKCVTTRLASIAWPVCHRSRYISQLKHVEKPCTEIFLALLGWRQRFRLNSSALPIALYLYMPTCGINEVFRKIKLEREDWREKTPLSQQT